MPETPGGFRRANQHQAPRARRLTPTAPGCHPLVAPSAPRAPGLPPCCRPPPPRRKTGAPERNACRRALLRLPSHRPRELRLVHLRAPLDAELLGLRVELVAGGAVAGALAAAPARRR